MIVERASSYNWAYSEDIPGNRCGPEDGPWPRPYQVLDEDELWRELRILAKPQSSQLGNYKADSINFQPSPTTKTQDRYVVTQLDVHGRLWTFTGVFDGHLGDVTVEHVAHHLPIIVRDFLREAEAATKEGTYAPEDISELFTKAIIAFDDAIAHDVLDLFGGSVEKLDDYTDAQIREIINDQHKGGANWRKARLCMYGTTALVALIDPEHRDLWIANLGDCQAIMASPSNNAKDWKIEVLTASHNGDNDAELDRVKQSHPGEPECIVDRRVLGALAPTRCFGDIPFKQPPAFTRRILYNLFPGFHNTSPWEEFLRRNQTPPYITAEPQIIYRKLDVDDTAAAHSGTTTPSPLVSRSSSISSIYRNKFWPGSKSQNQKETPPAQPPPAPGSRFLILTSDGFADLCEGEGQKRVIESWARGMVSRNPPESVTDSEPGSRHDNMALRLLRRAVGGDDRFGVSRVLTLDMDVAWIDDTSIVVQTL
ncbi:phosphatase 2C-like domain-containing protein [Gymnopilus junonius]|uniref:Phosphatase 2C-like domain-containing protein n=1 Tax=Gymnopilus junonius TaxID=109634 RepID=A0A9P5NMH5_GYMJU|nr:phosphatase 2C-like domain-containing protein [Gymnopilus junonius]